MSILHLHQLRHPQPRHHAPDQRVRQTSSECAVPEDENIAAALWLSRVTWLLFIAILAFGAVVVGIVTRGVTS